MELSEVKVYASSPWYPGQTGSLRNLKIEMKTQIAECSGTAGEMYFPLKNTSFETVSDPVMEQIAK